MKEMKCKTCGGLLEVDDDKEFGMCPYCKTKYKLNEGKTINIKIDDNTKESITKGYKLFGKISLAIIIPFILIFIFVIVLIIIGITSFNKSSKSFERGFFDIVSTQQNTQKSDIDDMYDKFNTNLINSKFEIYSGTKMGSSVSSLLDEVITNNKKNKDKLIMVEYGDQKTSVLNEIIDLKSNFDSFTYYEVIIDYDDNNLVNKITIENK